MPLNSHGIWSGTRSTSTLTPCSRASDAIGSLIAVALISPDFTASSRFVPPPYSLIVTSSRVRPSFCKASVTVESLSEPKVLTPTTPPLRSAAVLTPGAEKNVKRMTFDSEPMTPQIAAGLIDLDHRRQADMHDVDARRPAIPRRRGCRRSC